jgi:hypothetical protein
MLRVLKPGRAGPSRRKCIDYCPDNAVQRCARQQKARLRTRTQGGDEKGLTSMEHAALEVQACFVPYSSDSAAHVACPQHMPVPACHHQPPCQAARPMKLRQMFCKYVSHVCRSWCTSASEFDPLHNAMRLQVPCFCCVKYPEGSGACTGGEECRQELVARLQLLRGCCPSSGGGSSPAMNLSKHVT